MIPAQENHPPRGYLESDVRARVLALRARSGGRMGEAARGQAESEVGGSAKPNSRRYLSPRESIWLTPIARRLTRSATRIIRRWLAAMGMLPGAMADREDHEPPRSRRVMKDWKWAETWGWDYPMAAMTAARVGPSRKLAVDALLLDTPKNKYGINGHNFPARRAALVLAWKWRIAGGDCGDGEARRISQKRSGTCGTRGSADCLFRGSRSDSRKQRDRLPGRGASGFRIIGRCDRVGGFDQRPQDHRRENVDRKPPLIIPDSWSSASPARHSRHSRIGVRSCAIRQLL